MERGMLEVSGTLQGAGERTRSRHRTGEVQDSRTPCGEVWGRHRVAAVLYLTRKSEGREGAGHKMAGFVVCVGPHVCDGLHSLVPLPGLAGLGAVPCHKVVMGMGCHSFCFTLIISIIVQNAGNIQGARWSL